MIFLERPADFDPKMRVAACDLEHDGEILLLHRQPWKKEGNLWGIPAGKCKPDEDPLGAVIREVQEETNIDLFATPPTFRRVLYVRLSYADIEYHLFFAKFAVRPLITLTPDEHQAYRWVTPAEALTLPLMEDEDAAIKLCFGL